MGHKVHPYGFRLGVSRTWTAKWYADKDYTDLLREDEAGLLHFDQRITTPLAQASLVLPAGARQAIQRMTSAGLVN